MLRDLAVLNPDPKLRDDWSVGTVHRLATRFNVIENGDLHGLSVEFQDYQLCADGDLPPFNKETRIDLFWSDVSKLKTFTGATCFPHLADLMTSLSVIAHSNADSERVLSTPTHALSSETTLRALLSCKINRDEPCYSFVPDTDMLKGAKKATWDYVHNRLCPTWDYVHNHQ